MWWSLLDESVRSSSLADLSVTVQNQQSCRQPLSRDHEKVDDKCVDGSSVKSAATDNETDDWEDDKSSLRSGK